MNITDITYLSAYREALGSEHREALKNFEGADDISLEYLTQTSAVYSANIEGNSLDVNSYMNREVYEGKTEKNRDVEEISDLVEAYEFAQKNPLNEANMLHCHALLSRTLLIESKQGAYRQEPVGVFGSHGLIYLAVEHEKIPTLIQEVFANIENMGEDGVDDTEKLFYHASLLHLIFAHIHPFADGNGRIARLLEKWFLATLGGEKYWKLGSEQYYKEHRPEYYNAINLGVNFYELDYTKCLPFLLILPASVK